MLGVKTYTQEYVDASRASIDTVIGAHAKLAKAARTAKLDLALDAFDRQFFNNMVIALDHRFVHRLRGVEGKNGNPLNETRVLCQSIMENNSVMTADSTINMNPETSVLGHRVGDEIALGEQDFRRLADGFFAEIERRFV